MKGEQDITPFAFQLLPPSPFWLAILFGYFFLAIKILASMPLFMNSGAVKPAACIHAATSVWV